MKVQGASKQSLYKVHLCLVAFTVGCCIFLGIKTELLSSQTLSPMQSAIRNYVSNITSIVEKKKGKPEGYTAFPARIDTSVKQTKFLAIKNSSSPHKKINAHGIINAANGGQTKTPLLHLSTIMNNEKPHLTTVDVKTGKHTKQVVLLLTNFRSGSTFLGELFNQNPEIYYQFEPLAPFQFNCEVLAKERVKFLSQILKCDFTRVIESYRNAQRITNFFDKFIGCLSSNLCFAQKNTGLKTKYEKLCTENVASIGRQVAKNGIAKGCPGPYKLPLLSRICHEAKIVAYKFIRVCSIESISHVLQSMSDSGYDVQIVHLVRDPRGVISSIVGLESKLEVSTVKREAKRLCERYRKNLHFDESKKDKSAESWNKRYIRIRYEDLASNLAETAEKVYRFLGRKVPREVKDWIRETQPNITQVMLDLKKENELKRIGKANVAKLQKSQFIIKESQHPYSTTRDANEFKTKWRKTLSMERILAVQDECRDVMLKLGYQIFSSQNEVNNYTIPFYITAQKNTQV